MNKKLRSRSRRQLRNRSQPDVNLNSFLDLVLNILLFFVFATEIAAFEALDVKVPVTKYSEAVSTPKEGVILYITKDNQLQSEGHVIPIDELPTWLQTKKKRPDFFGLIVRGDLNSNLQTMVDVLAACRLVSIDKVKVETEKPK